MVLSNCISDGCDLQFLRASVIDDGLGQQGLNRVLDGVVLLHSWQRIPTVRWAGLTGEQQPSPAEAVPSSLLALGLRLCAEPSKQLMWF